MIKLNNQCVLSRNEDYFVAWLIETLAPVIFGTKPAELLSFSKTNIDSPAKIEKIEKYIGQCTRITYRIFEFKNNSVKVLFYNPTSMEKCLSDIKNKKFLESLGYSTQYGIERHIEHLIAKIKEGEIPPEIGVFLGYPLKDIMGFMGHPSLKLTKVNGWRIYGDPTLSDKKYNEFSKAKKQIKELLTLYEPENILLAL